MAAKRVTTITCLFLLLLFASWISFAQATQGRKNILADSNYETAVSTKKGLMDGEHAVIAATNKKHWLGGRKMVMEGRQMEKQKDVKMIGGAVAGKSFSKFSSSTNSECGDYNSGSCNHQTVNNFSDEVDDHVHEHDKSGFVAFNADYHAPRHHPPKNN